MWIFSRSGYGIICTDHLLSICCKEKGQNTAICAQTVRGDTIRLGEYSEIDAERLLEDLLDALEQGKKTYMMPVEGVVTDADGA